MYQVFQITGSSLWVGIVGLAQFVPTILLALVGGVVADAMDRRTLLVRVQVGMAMVSGGLAYIATTANPSVAAIITLAALNSALAAFDGPARTAVIPMLVEQEHLRSAIQLREVLTQSGRVLGPMLGGLLIAAFGVWFAYAVDAASFVFAFLLFLGLPKLMPERQPDAGRPSIMEGLRFVKSRPVLASTFIADLIAMILGMPRAVFPALALVVYDVGPAGLGLIGAAPAAGAVIGLLFSGLTSRVDREGLAVIVSVAIWGIAIALAGAIGSFVPTLILLAIAGCADMISALFRQTIMLSIVPDDLRGRMSSVHIMVVTGGPPMGDMQIGASAELFGPRRAMAIGGLACAGCVGILALKVREFTTWRKSDSDAAAATHSPD
jgi:MFS family permease